MMYLQQKDRLTQVSNGVSYTVLSTEPVAGRLRLFNELEVRDEYVSLDDLRSGIADEKWLHEPTATTTRPQVRKSPQAQHNPELDARTEQALHAVREVARLAKSASISISQAIERVRANREKGRALYKLPSNPTIYRLLYRERNHLPLYLGDANKGNRTCKRSHEVRSLVVTLGKQLFAQVGSRWTLRDLVEHINDTAIDKRFIPAGDRISRKYVRDVIAAEVGPDLDIDRMDPRTANAFKSVAQTCIVASLPFERIEQDTLHLPWRVVTKDGISHGVQLTHAIDCYTGMPVGWLLGVGAPNVTKTLECIERTLYSKSKVFKKLGIQNGKDVFGTMHTLVLDNGPENKGERITKLAHLGIDVIHCKANTPQEKPYIERLNRALKEALQTLPGCTRFDDVDGVRDPAELDDLPMSLEDMERWIVRWYFDDWANRKLKRLLMSKFIDPEVRGNTPWTRWRFATEQRGQPVALPPTRQEWRKTLYVYESRTLSRKTGITYRSFSYRGPNIQRILDIYGEKPVDVLVSPEDFRRVHVLGPSEELIELVNVSVDETTPAYSFEQAAQLYESFAEEDPIGAAEQRNFRRDVHNASTSATPKRAKQEKAQKKPAQSKETSQRAKTAAAVGRAQKSPLLSTASTEAAAASPVTSNFDDLEVLPVLDRRTGDAS